MTALWIYVIATAHGPAPFATTSDQRACEAIAAAFSSIYQIAGVCVRVIPGVAS